MTGLSFVLPVVFCLVGGVAAGNTAETLSDALWENNVPAIKHFVSSDSASLTWSVCQFPVAQDPFFTILHLAVVRGRRDIVHICLKNSESNANLQNVHGYTPLALASCADEGMVSDLLRAGADVNIIRYEYSGDTFLHRSILEGSETLVHSLLQFFTKDTINTVNNEGVTPLMLASSRSSSTLIEHLLESGAAHSINVRNMAGTALHEAVRAENVFAVGKLLKHGADIEIVDPVNKQNPLHLSTQKDAYILNAILLNAASSRTLLVQDAFGDCAAFNAYSLGSSLVFKLVEKRFYETTTLADRAEILDQILSACKTEEEREATFPMADLSS